MITDEQPIEDLWRIQGGVDPQTGKMWLTPRMERLAKRLLEQWYAEKQHDTD